MNFVLPGIFLLCAVFFHIAAKVGQPRFDAMLIGKKAARDPARVGREKRMQKKILVLLWVIFGALAIVSFFYAP